MAVAKTTARSESVKRSEAMKITLIKSISAMVFIVAAAAIAGSVMYSAASFILADPTQDSSAKIERIEVTDLIPVEQIKTAPVERIEIADLIRIEQIKTKPVKQSAARLGERYASVGEYFKAGNPNATTYRLGEPPIKRKSFSPRERNGGCCQVCGSTTQLEAEHRRGLQNGGDNSDGNMGTLCHPCHLEKTAMDKSLRRQRETLIKQVCAKVKRNQ